MENLLTGQKVFGEIFLTNENIINGIVDLSCHKCSQNKTLLSQVKYINDFDINNIVINDELSDRLVYKITLELAVAIDKNSPIDVKRIKNQYGSTNEFVKAKDFLNKKCKLVWDVFDKKNQKLNVPNEALKALGISNKPTLDFLLNNIKLFEKENDNTTVNIISSILNNPNLDYTINDIYNYLKEKHIKDRCQYNLVTVKYLAQKLDYNFTNLSAIGVDKQNIKKIISSLSLCDKILVILKLTIWYCKNL